MYRKLPARHVGIWAGMAALGLFTSHAAASFDLPTGEFCPVEAEVGTYGVGSTGELPWASEATLLAGHCRHGHHPPHQVVPTTSFRGYSSYYGGYGGFGGLPGYYPSNYVTPQVFRYYPSTYGGAWAPRPLGGCHKTYRVIW